MIRSQVLSIKELDYMLAARAIGAGQVRIMLRHILPNVRASFIVLSTITLGYAIVVEAALSFWGWESRRTWLLGAACYPLAHPNIYTSNPGWRCFLAW